MIAVNVVRSRVWPSPPWAIAAVLCAAAPSGAAGPVKIDFTEQVQPILAEHCAHCHGLDPETRAGGLRLDIRDAALAGGDSGLAAIAVGKPA